MAVSFDNIDQERLLEMLAERIDDKALLQLIGKWLKAGVLDTNGEVIHPAAGTPQGGIVSPILANIYLHYCLDEWFQHVVKKHCGGEACLIRYADDFVCAFEREGDAERFYQVLGKRLEKFGLELSAEKTRVIAFDRGQSKPEGFEFLGFEFRWGQDRQGKAHVKRRTSRKKLRRLTRPFHRMVPRDEALPSQRVVQRVEAETSGILQLLRSERQLREPATILWGSNADSPEMAQPAAVSGRVTVGKDSAR